MQKYIKPGWIYRIYAYTHKTNWLYIYAYVHESRTTNTRMCIIAGRICAWARPNLCPGPGLPWDGPRPDKAVLGWAQV